MCGPSPAARRTADADRPGGHPPPRVDGRRGNPRPGKAVRPGGHGLAAPRAAPPGRRAHGGGGWFGAPLTARRPRPEPRVFQDFPTCHRRPPRAWHTPSRVPRDYSRGTGHGTATPSPPGSHWPATGVARQARASPTTSQHVLNDTRRLASRCDHTLKGRPPETTACARREGGHPRAPFHCGTPCGVHCAARCAARCGVHCGGSDHVFHPAADAAGPTAHRGAGPAGSIEGDRGRPAVETGPVPPRETESTWQTATHENARERTGTDALTCGCSPCRRGSSGSTGF
ncbi:hypothetical protein SAMN05421505_113155 [Sinosporangium album]|uniref:Uncharacterized protein n=1 Tax=Sinosporangium album TaxID=504805 RepID=A0A1G8B5X5_9ACTN|nr:hypothetical protein SAMN05421505_113155 [Sinosporangium album]